LVAQRYHFVNKQYFLNLLPMDDMWVKNFSPSYRTCSRQRHDGRLRGGLVEGE
jgi:hypothetical protein